LMRILKFSNLLLLKFNLAHFSVIICQLLIIIIIRRLLILLDFVNRFLLFLWALLLSICLSLPLRDRLWIFLAELLCLNIVHCANVLHLLRSKMQTLHLFQHCWGHRMCLCGNQWLFFGQLNVLGVVDISSCLGYISGEWQKSILVRNSPVIYWASNCLYWWGLGLSKFFRLWSRYLRLCQLARSFLEILLNRGWFLASAPSIFNDLLFHLLL
jgi:hypothetical protein